MDLSKLSASLHDCQRCQLSTGRTQVVFGTGNPQASIMFVGEAPGFYEDREGVPFVGAAGKLLTELLQWHCQFNLLRTQWNGFPFSAYAHADAFHIWNDCVRHSR